MASNFEDMTLIENFSKYKKIFGHFNNYINP